MKNLGRNFIMIALGLSFLLHLSTALVVYIKTPPPKPSEAIEFVVVDNQSQQIQKEKVPNQARQIVEQSEKAINDEIDEKAKYLSRHNQRVVTETRAANNGKFSNQAKMGEARQSPQNQLAEKKENREQKKPNENGDLPRLASLKPQFRWDKAKDTGVSDPGLASASDDHLKDTKTGPQTLLSTREFVYYSYYSRIKDRLRLFWEPKIKEKINRIMMSGRRIASEDERITKLIITLNQEGKLVRVQVMGESGLKDLDDAAVEAFQSAAPFPNPPKGIIESDGTIRIRWDFILEAGDEFMPSMERVLS